LEHVTVAEPNTEKPNADLERFVIRCGLIPIKQTIGIILFLVVLSTLSWLVIVNGSKFHSFSGAGQLTLLAVASAIMQMALIPFLIKMAVKIELELTGKGIQARSPFHKDSLYSRTARQWNDLHSVRLRKMVSPGPLLERLSREKTRQATTGAKMLWHSDYNWKDQGFLMLDFRSGGQIVVPLAGLTAQAMEDLFVALSRWADPMSFNPDVLSLQRNILSGQNLQVSDNYTHMWEESLRSRFEVTNFVPLMGGDVLRNGELRILMLLSCGGLSSVYLARNKKGERLIVKEMAVTLSDDKTALAKLHEMFAREARLLARLDHPRIVKVVDHFVEKERDYLVLQFVPGLTLRQQVQMKGPFSEAETIGIAKQIAEVLIYLHNFDPPILHRDLTPDNLVISDTDEHKVTLIDFGAANEFIGSVTGTLIGKQCYIAPEQFRGEAVPQSDLYSCGATLHFLLTGEDPEPISETHPKAVRADLSEWMDTLVAACTSLDVGKRIKSAEALMELLASEPSTVQA
jgi:tRNA A-37 threonylcarbamoyl transferase component Bud32